jgi:hypothetical protein
MIFPIRGLPAGEVKAGGLVVDGEALGAMVCRLTGMTGSVTGGVILLTALCTVVGDCAAAVSAAVVVGADLAWG